MDQVIWHRHCEFLYKVEGRWVLKPFLGGLALLDYGYAALMSVWETFSFTCRSWYNIVGDDGFELIGLNWEFDTGRRRPRARKLAR